nr:hypothetical protein [uncultured Hyphomonas sp.]
MAHLVAAPVSRGKWAGANRFALAGCAALPISILEDEKEMAGDPHRHTKSEGLKRLLRRRNRRMKTGANSGDKVYSWAEYSQVNFTPTGDRSSISYGLIAFLFAFAFLLIPVLVGVTDAVLEGQNFFVLVRYIIRALLDGFFFLVLAATPVALIGWIYASLDGDGENNRARLIAAADKLRAEQAETQDEDANRAR